MNDSRLKLQNTNRDITATSQENLFTDAPLLINPRQAHFIDLTRVPVESNKDSRENEAKHHSSNVKKIGILKAIKTAVLLLI